MWKLESPAARYGSSTHEPKSVEGLHFSNAMTNPAGSILSQCALSPNPHTTQSFDGFRFEKTRSQEAEEHKHELVTTGVDCIVFSHGRHGCPGRFFVKVLLARVLLKNDFQNGGWTGCS
ncbi:hypothetical protein M378DRAFT_170265 [Amanita muscaria Koide BX008]|uniref:Cytochrome P450 n=1 Tax=Amanita muscaria (strain Koide BX008) TaxID=946122 RepID=A0A0C2WPR2_AMAMK|nr:hypothetical protein M378DRAFT_170265 [Amanita muscaria Koide BX008]